MILDFFEQYNINTDDLKDKLGIIKECKLENASYISYILKNALEYLFEPVDLNIKNLKRGFPAKDEDIDATIYFSTENEDDIKELLSKENKFNLIIIGNHKTRIINHQIICINIKDFRKIKIELSKYKNISIVFNIENVDFNKYYYNRMRTYFLNLAHNINKTSIDDLKKDTNSVCTKLLLDKNNFESKCHFLECMIDFKKMILTYYKILKLVSVKDYFYILNSELNDRKIDKELSNKQKILLNELDTLISIQNLESNEKKVSAIYDIVCDNMLKEVSKLNYCNFINNKCIKMRYTGGFPNSKENGCCSNTYLDKRKNCRYLNEDYSCSICCISCRVFTCTYLQERGIDHSLWQYPVIDCNIRKLSRIHLVRKFFTPKDKIVRKVRNKLK